MKKVLFYLPLAFFAAVVVVSCDKEVEVQQENAAEDQIVSDVKAEPRTFSMIFDPSLATKLSINGSGKTSWEIDDEILIHGEYINKTGYSVVAKLDGVTNTISPDGKTAYINITVTGDADPVAEGCVKEYVHKSDEVRDYISTLYAAYPASAVTSGEHHSYYNTLFEATNEPLLLAYDDGDGNFVFRNLCSLITFVMPDLDGDPATNDFDHYVFYGNNSESVAYDTYAAVYAKYSSGSVKNRQGGTYDSSVTTGAKTSVSGPVKCDGSSLNKIFIPGLTNGSSPSNGILFEKGFTIEFIKDGDITHKVSTSSKISLAVGDFLPLGDISAALKPYSRPDHVSSLSSTKDLSVILGGRANCYYVAADVAANAGETFKFPQYQGNSSDAIGRVYDVELVWETDNDDSAPAANSIIKAIDYDNTYIYFELPNPIVPGNALIAAKNAVGEIMWSWHIWIPQTSITNNSGVYSTSIMDRNLGALVPTSTGVARTVASYGLFYQWGRKDPFVGAKSTTSGTFASVTGRKVSTAGTAITLARSIANPTLIGTGGGGNDWVSVSDNALWKDDEKTKYDPCPPTYRVPKKDDSQLLHSTLTGTANLVIDGTKFYFTIGSPASVFPFTGFLDDWGSFASVNYNSSEQRANLWTSSWHYNNVGYGVDVRTADNRYKISDFGKARGCSVRCVKE